MACIIATVVGQAPLVRGYGGYQFSMFCALETFVRVQSFLVQIPLSKTGSLLRDGGDQGRLGHEREKIG